jgi:hypothetical protein
MSAYRLTFLDSLGLAALVAGPLIIDEAKESALYDFHREIARYEVSEQEREAQRAAFESFERVNRMMVRSCMDSHARSQLVRVQREAGEEACE